MNEYKAELSRYYSRREEVVKIVCLQSFENQDESIHQPSNPPKSGINRDNS